MPRFYLTSDYDISRVIKGGWQLAGGHGQVHLQDALEDMLQYVKAGITTFDCADIYTGVEELIGAFLRRHKHAFGTDELPSVQIHTKYVPDLSALSRLSRQDVEKVIDRSLTRLGLDRLDLVQFHWWDYDTPRYVEAALHLKALQGAGKIRHIGVTNFDVMHLKDITDAGVTIVSNQVQYSVLDQRPEGEMTDFCHEHDIVLLCYGTLAGGFVTDSYRRTPEPRTPHENRSLTKYALIIDDTGGWSTFQETLDILREVADKHKVDIADVATRYVMQKPRVAAAIVGSRNARYLVNTSKLFTFELDSDDLSAIRRQVSQTNGLLGEVYGIERIKEGKHAGIMKYDLNKD
ncbi:MAG: aldo/keto reductase [Candidatus Latescibacteria bacterium]|nr:aldo/keto reductase [Candidatus Latescibacterota bacterium]